MSYFLYLVIGIKAGGHDFGTQKVWLPGPPPGAPQQLGTYPLHIPEWKIRVSGFLGIKITITISLLGQISLYVAGPAPMPPVTPISTAHTASR